MIDDRETERRLEAWLQDAARPMPEYVLESSIEAVARTGQVSPNRPVAVRWLDKRKSGVAAIAAVLVVGLTVGPVLVERFGSSLRSTFSGANACVQPPPGITGWWPGDGIPLDVVGAHDADLVGGATFAPGIVGEAFTLDGDGDFVDVRDDPGLDVGRRDFSVSLWVRFRDTDGEQVLAEQWVQRHGEPSHGWTLTKLEDNSFGFFTEDGQGEGNGARSRPLDLPSLTWIHVAARRVGETVDIHVNGERVAAERKAGAIFDLNTEASLKFGHRGGLLDTPGSEDTSGFFLDGLVDEVQLLIGRAVSEDEVQDAYRARGAGMCTPDASRGGS